MILNAEERDWIVARAKAAGFDLAGLAHVPGDAEADAAAEDARFTSFIDAGHAGEMDYLKRVDESGAYLRGNLRRAMPWARSVAVCAINYNAEAPLSIKPAEPGTGWIARYAWSGNESGAADYHDLLLPRLRAVEAELLSRFGETCRTRCYVDTGPILERGYAARAGVGWIGKNTCVLNQQQGSWLLLGVIVTSLELAPEAMSVAAADRCGTCTRCIDACPTHALLDPALTGERSMDASRCIAYLTIEKKGSIDEHLRDQMGRQVFGCDICQDVCPWNRKAPVPPVGWPVRRELVNPALAWLASMDGSEFNRVFRGSPLERTRRARVLRNVAIAMGNSGRKDYLQQLDAWSLEGDAVLAEAATWAAARLREDAQRASLEDVDRRSRENT